MEIIYEFLNENDLGYRVYIGNENSEKIYIIK